MLNNSFTRLESLNITEIIIRKKPIILPSPNIFFQVKVYYLLNVYLKNIYTHTDTSINNRY